jgi:predicted PurR-regulated permease PerM
MRIFRIIIAVFALALIIYYAININYSDLSWHTNRSNYLWIISMIIIFISMILSIIPEAKRRKKI